jgi:serine/threonine protein kinase
MGWTSLVGIGHYQYGVGSTGFGAWRELAAHILTTNWVMTGTCSNFPMLYHWRILPLPSQEPDEMQLMQLDKDVKYWNNSLAIHDRLKASLYASANIVLFLEYFPQNLYQWFGKQIAHGGSAMEAAARMIEAQLTQTIAFMKAQNFLHFDAHFYNILTEGNHLYFSDFGLAISSEFDLSQEEQAFFDGHCDYDNYSAFTNLLHCFVTQYAEKDNWIESLRKFMNENIYKLSPQMASVIKRYAPIAVLMDKFYRELQRDKTTLYPAKELKIAWDA